MELKGELKRNGLPSLFRNFATEHFHGLLTITSSVGEKLITLTENEVTIFCDELNESSRLGNILQGRNLITEEALDDALRDQKKLEPRPKLGDMLVQRGLVTEKAISDARRFQIEEDICDILSWKKARFSFAGADSAREVHPEDFAPDQVHRMTIDPDTFFKYVTKVTEDWDAIGDRLPTQYLCFKVSAKVEESMSKLTQDAQRVLRFLKEGRSVEGAVKQSCLGRIQVCVQVIELLEKGLVLPASGPDLRFMASEHRALKRYHDALYIYRRLLESPDSEDERPYLENLIEEISETIIRLKQRGEYGEEAIVFSHKLAKDNYVKSQFKRKLFLGIAGAAALLAAGYFLISRGKPQENLTERYREVIRRVDTLSSSGKFNLAIKELDDLADSLTDKDGYSAQLIQQRKNGMPGLINNYIEIQLSKAPDKLQHAGDERDEAIKDLKELLDEYPGNANEQRIKDLIAKYDIKKQTDPAPVEPSKDPGPSFAAREELLERLRKADALVQQSKYSEATREYVAISQQSPANGDIWKLANEGSKKLREIEQNANDKVKQAETSWTDKKGEKAIVLIGQAIPLYGDLEGFGNAAALQARWNSISNNAHQTFVSAKELEDQNSIFEAKVRYEQVARNYTEFQIAVEAAKKAAALQLKCDVLLKTIESAAEEVRRGNYKKAREIYRPLLESNRLLLIDQHVQIPISVTSFPDHSLLKVNGEKMGTTPKNVMIGVGDKFEIVIERPGFSSKRIATEGLTVRDFDMTLRLELDPIVIDFPTPALQQPAPLLAPPAMLDNQLLILNGPELLAIIPPNKDVVWSIPGLYDPRGLLPDNVPGDEKNYWNFRVAPLSYKPGFLLLPTRAKELLEFNVLDPKKPEKRSLFKGLSTPPPEIVGSMYVEEHSKLAGKPLLIAAFADGQVRCYVDFDARQKMLTENWSLPIDPQAGSRPEAPAAGLYGYKSGIWALSGSGMLQSFDPIEKKAVWNRQFPAMSPRSTFSTRAGDSLLAMVQRNGKVILFDLERKEEVWSLPPRQAMEESVGVAIDASGVFVTARNQDNGELSKYARMADANASVPKALSSVKLDAFVTLDMALGKHLYLVTKFNQVFAFSKNDLSMLWEFKLKPEMGEPRSIRVFGDYVYVSTDKGKLIILKSE